MQVTCKMKSAEKDLYRKNYTPKFRFYLFSPNTFSMTIKPLKAAAKIVFMGR